MSDGIRSTPAIQANSAVAAVLVRLVGLTEKQAVAEVRRLTGKR